MMPQRPDGEVRGVLALRISFSYAAIISMVIPNPRTEVMLVWTTQGWEDEVEILESSKCSEADRG